MTSKLVSDSFCNNFTKIIIIVVVVIIIIIIIISSSSSSISISISIISISIISISIISISITLLSCLKLHNQSTFSVWWSVIWANGWSGYGLPPWPPNGERLHVPPRRETHTRWLDASFVQKIRWWYSCKNAKYWCCHYVSYYPQWPTSQSIAG